MVHHGCLNHHNHQNVQGESKFLMAILGSVALTRYIGEFVICIFVCFYPNWTQLTSSYHQRQQNIHYQIPIGTSFGSTTSKQHLMENRSLWQRLMPNGSNSLMEWHSRFIIIPIIFIIKDHHLHKSSSSSLWNITTAIINTIDNISEVSPKLRAEKDQLSSSLLLLQSSFFMKIPI